MAKKRKSNRNVEPVTARVFRNGRNQAIRIPVELSFETDEVTIERRGDALLVRPKYDVRNCWDSFFDDPSMALPQEFDTGEDPPVEDRDDLF